MWCVNAYMFRWREDRLPASHSPRGRLVQTFQDPRLSGRSWSGAVRKWPSRRLPPVSGTRGTATRAAKSETAPAARLRDARVLHPNRGFGDRTGGPFPGRAGHHPRREFGDRLGGPFPGRAGPPPAPRFRSPPRRPVSGTRGSDTRAAITETAPAARLRDARVRRPRRDYGGRPGSPFPGRAGPPPAPRIRRPPRRPDSGTRGAATRSAVSETASSARFRNARGRPFRALEDRKTACIPLPPVSVGRECSTAPNRGPPEHRGDG